MLILSYCCCKYMYTYYWTSFSLQEINELKTKNTELESNQLKSKNVFLTAKAKITSQKEQLERLTSEVTEQKRLLEDVDKTKSKYLSCTTLHFKLFSILCYRMECEHVIQICLFFVILVIKLSSVCRIEICIM